MIDSTPGHASAEQIWRTFETEYLNVTGSYGFVATESQSDAAGGGAQAMTARITIDSQTKIVSGRGNGPLAAFVDAMKMECGIDFELAGYREHIIGTGSKAEVAAYVELRFPSNRSFHGAGIDTSMAVASLKAVVSGVNRALKRR
ncbi:MAG: alpha-isopropylmalate synthase regulatory domain-containing protein [Hyphomicrobiales bacterium]